MTKTKTTTAGKTAKMLSMFALAFSLFTSCNKSESKPAEPAPAPAPVYTNFKITSVKITAMPFLNGNNVSWDLADGPDVFFNMEDVNSNVLFNGSTSRYNNISQSSLPLNWNFGTAYAITNLGVTHFVTLYDYDTRDPNDLIGFVGFKMEDHKSGYPSTVTKSSGGISVTITGSWY
jgi:hypothetical protein